MRRMTLHVIGTLLFASTILYGQQISGTITGVVKDSQQASVAAAKVAVTNQEQGTTRDVLTGADGSFEIRNLPPGDYVIEAWHETLGTHEQKITVLPQGTTVASFTFKGE